MLDSNDYVSNITPAPRGDPSSQFMSRLGSAKHHSLVRITGGCANMSASDAWRMLGLFKEAFLGFQGALLVGATRMVDKAVLEDMPAAEAKNPLDILAYLNDHSPTVIGITEAGPTIRENNDCVLLGVLGRSHSLNWHYRTGLVLVKRTPFDDPDDVAEDRLAVALQPRMDAVAVVDEQISRASLWHDEAIVCCRIADVQRQQANWSTALVVYNGGEVTKYEARLVAEKQWPVILIQGSGRAADELAANQDFLGLSPNTIVCDLDSTSLRDALIRTGSIVPPSEARMLHAVS